MVYNKSSKVYSTASPAGRTEGREWTSARILEARLRELVLHQGRLLGNGLASNNDEVITARRVFQRLMGPTGVGFFQWEKDMNGKKCWSHLVSNKEQATLTLKSLEEGLLLAKGNSSEY